MVLFKRFYWLRVFIFVIVPILLSISLFVFPYSFDFTRVNETKVIGINASKTEQILKYQTPKYSTKPIEKAKNFALSFLTDVLRIPLDFHNVDYCFKDKKTYLEYYTIQGSQFDYTNFNWTLNFDNEVNYTIFRNSKQCVTINTTRTFTYYWGLKFDIAFRPGYTKGLTFHPNTTSYGRKNFYEILRLSITLILAWMAIFWVLYNVWNVIHKPEYRLK